MYGLGCYGDFSVVVFLSTANPDADDPYDDDDVSTSCSVTYLHLVVRLCDMSVAI